MWVVSPSHDEAALGGQICRRDVPFPGPEGVRNREVAAVHPKWHERIRSIGPKHHLPRSRVLAIGADDKIESVSVAVGEENIEETIVYRLDLIDGCSNDILGAIFGSIVEKLAQISPHAFKVGGEALEAFSASICWKKGPLFPMSVHNL